MSLKVVLWCAFYKHTISIPYDYIETCPRFLCLIIFLQASLSPTQNTASATREQSVNAPSNGEYTS